MHTTASHALVRALTVVSAAALLAGCAGDAPVAPELHPSAAPLATLSSPNATATLGTLRRVTARYHDLRVALAEGFVLLHDCESRPGEGPVGTVYVHPGRLMDGRIDAERPDALIYEPQRDGLPELVGAEFAVPYAIWPEPQPPRFLGATFQREDEFGVYALHAWIWRDNPEGMFAETNPRVSCLSD